MDVAALAALAGNTLVTVAVTDAWEDVRHKIARLFGCGQPDPQAERRLDATRGLLATAKPAELSQVQVAEAVRWESRFADLLAEHPEAVAELTDLVKDLTAALPTGGGNVANTISGGTLHGPVLMGRDFTFRNPGSALGA
jgi:hypothetical protein